MYNRLRYLKNIFTGGVDAVSHSGYLQDRHVDIQAVFLLQVTLFWVNSEIAA